jgi:hypothetical protein
VRVFSSIIIFSLGSSTSSPFFHDWILSIMLSCTHLKVVWEFSHALAISGSTFRCSLCTEIDGMINLIKIIDVMTLSSLKVAPHLIFLDTFLTVL